MFASGAMEAAATTMRVEPQVMALVLCAALMHASWNAIVKSDKDRLVSFGMIMLAGSVAGLLVAPFVPLPKAEAWPYLIASILIHNFYYYFLLSAYSHGDLSHVYPIARGLGPLLVALSSGLFGEALHPHEGVGVLLISLGIVGLAMGQGFGLPSSARATIFAVLTGITIAGYTVADGLGARYSGDALGYIAWLNIAEGPWVMLVALYRRRGAAIVHLRSFWWRGTLGGVIATAGYGIAIWALSLGAMAHVAALRETSVLFAALMGTFLLKERFGLWRVGAAALIVSGLILMNVPL